MVKIRNAVSAFAIGYALIILAVVGFAGFQEGYDITEENTKGGLNVMQRLNQLNLIEGLNDLTAGVQALGKLSNPFDLLGALALSGSGSLQVIGGIVTFPFDIADVIFGTADATGFYDALIPPIVAQLIGFLAVISIAFVILSAKLGFEV